MTKDYGDYQKTFLEFQKPADIDGTSFLTWENEGKDDTQYLFLPALGRSRRIVSSQKKLQFVNTDYTYEDMQRRRPHKDIHTLLREEPLFGRDCYIVESIPHEGTSQYSKRVNWINKTSFFILKTDFYDKKNRVFKQFYVDVLEEVQGFWTAMATVMIDLKYKARTYMQVTEIRYNEGIKDNVFKVHYQESR